MGQIFPNKTEVKIKLYAGCKIDRFPLTSSTKLVLVARERQVGLKTCILNFI